jgi:type VI protein secretion system component VasK
LSRTQRVSIIAAIVATVAAWFYPPFPPLEAVVHSEIWTRTLAGAGWFVVLLFFVSLSDFSDKQIDITKEGITGRRLKERRTSKELRRREQLRAENELELRRATELRDELIRLEEEKQALRFGEDEDV